MGLIDDIKNMKPLPEHKWTLEELLKIEKKILKKGQKSILKELMKQDNIKFTNKDKPVVVDFNRTKSYYKNNPIYQREKVEQDGDDERRNAI